MSSSRRRVIAVMPAAAAPRGASWSRDGLMAERTKTRSAPSSTACVIGASLTMPPSMRSRPSQTTARSARPSSCRATPRATSTIYAATRTFRRYDDRYQITAKLHRDARALPGRLQQAAGPLQRVTVQAFGVVSRLLTVLTLAFLLTLHGREYMGMALRLTGDREARYRALVIDINQAVAKYMLGNVAISGLATVATWLVLTVLGVPYALSLGLLVGFFDLLPLVGATLGAIIVGVATATVDFPTATIVWIAFIIVYQRIENSLIQPLVYGRALKVNPIVTILAVLVGASRLGILGALLAIPPAAAIQILLRDWSTHRPAPDTTDAHAPAHNGSSA